MIEAIDPKTMIPTTNGCMLVESLLESLKYDESLFLLALTNLAMSRETKEINIQNHCGFFVIY